MAPETDVEQGIYRGRKVARRFDSPDGMIVLVGKAASDNDVLTFKLAGPKDFWLHVGGQSGSHVVVLNPDGLDRLPRETERFAAGLAVGYSSARRAGKMKVHVAQISDLRKPRGAPAGQVRLGRSRDVDARPLRPGDEES
jgi:predicted ribosome quality control (RQC) complex YloA/Tae2 family protein